MRFTKPFSDMFNPFRRKPVNPGRELALVGIEKRRAKVRAKCDEMRAQMGMEPISWEKP